MICAKNRRTQIGIASTFSNELTDTLTQCRFQKDAEEEHRPSKSPHDLFLLSRTHRRRRMHLCTEFVFATGLNLGPPAATVAVERQPADRRTTDPESAPTRNGAFWMVERTDGRSDGGAAPDRETVPVEGRRRAATRTSGRAPQLTHFLRTRCPLSLPPKSPEQLQQCNSKRWETEGELRDLFGQIWTAATAVLVFHAAGPHM